MKNSLQLALIQRLGLEQRKYNSSVHETLQDSKVFFSVMVLISKYGLLKVRNEPQPFQDSHHWPFLLLPGPRSCIKATLPGSVNTNLKKIEKVSTTREQLKERKKNQKNQSQKLVNRNLRKGSAFVITDLGVILYKARTGFQSKIMHSNITVFDL